MEAIPSSGTEGNEDPKSIIKYVNILITQYFQEKLSKEQISSTLGTLKYCSQNLTSILMSDPEIIDHCISILFYWGLQFEISTTESQDSFLELYSEVISEFVCILPSSQRNAFIIQLIDVISKLLSEKTPLIIDEKMIKTEKTIKIESGGEIYAMITCLEILNQVLERVLANIPEILYLLNDLFQMKNPDIDVHSLKCISNFTPTTVNLSISEIRMLIKFYMTKKATGEKGRNENEIEEIDNYLTRSFKKATSKLNKNVAILLGRELLSFIATLEKDYFYKSFVDAVLLQVYGFIQLDMSCSNMASDLINNKFDVFQESKSYVEICSFLSQKSPAFIESLKANYASNKTCTPSLMKIVPTLSFQDDFYESCPTSVLYAVCANMSQELDAALSQKLNAEIRAGLDKPTFEQLTELVKYIPIDIIIDKFESQDLAKLYSKYPEKLDNVLSIWIRFSSDDNALPFICLIAKRAYYSGSKEFAPLQDYIRKKPNNIQTWSSKEYRDVLSLVFTDKEILSLFNELQRSMEISEIPDDLADFFLACKPIATKFLTILVSTISCENTSIVDIAVAFNIMKRSGKQLRDIYFYNRYDIAYHLFLIAKRNYRYFVVLSKEIFQVKAAKISIIQNEVIPAISEREDLQAITDFVNILKYEAENGKEKDKYVEIPDEKTLVERLWAEINAYLFSRFEKHKISSCLKFLTTRVLPGNNSTRLLDSAFTDLAPLIILNLGDENESIVKQTMEGMKILWSIEKKKRSESNFVRAFWMYNIIKLTFDFNKIMMSGYYSEKQQAIRAMTRSLDSLKEDLDKIGTKLLSMVDIAMSDPKVRPSCFIFYEKFFMQLDSESTVIKEVFGSLVSQLLFNFKEYPKETLRILKLIIIDRKNQIKDCFFQIAKIKELYIYPELEEIKNTVVASIAGKIWTEHAKMLMDTIPGATPQLQLILIQQLISIFKENSTSLHQFLYKEKLGIIVWKVLVQSQREDLHIQCGRLLSMIAPDLINNESLAFNDALEKKDASKVMRIIISDYLVLVFEDSQLSSIHKYAACAIQILLKELGCSTAEEYQILSTSSQARRSKSMTDRGEMNWSQFDPKVQAVIEKYRGSKYSSLTPKKVQFPVFANGIHEKNKWISYFTEALIQVECDKSERQQNAFQLKSIALFFIHFPQVCNFLMPYLCYWQRLNESFHNVFSSEFYSLYTHVTDSSSKFHDYSRIDMQMMFNIFDKIAQFNIYPSNNHAFPSATYFDIASDDDIYKAAYCCQLYTHALMYLELAIRDEWTDEQRDHHTIDERRQKQMKQIYKYLNEADMLDALKRLMPKNAIRDETLSVSEMKILSHNVTTDSTESSGINFFSKMLRSGKYERTLVDAMQYRTALRCDRRIDAIIARAATRLFRWDVIPDIVEPVNTLFSPVVDKRQQLLDSIDITIAEALCFLNQRDYSLFDKLIEKTRCQLATPFQQDATVSFERMMPSIINFHIIEELNDFAELLKKGKKPDVFAWKQWIDDTSISIDDTERLISIHCAMLKIAYGNSKDLKEKLMQQWLELAKACRKSGELFRAQMSCSRAAQCVMCPATTIESAKICLAQHESAQAISIVSSCIKEGDADFGKATYLRAQWSSQTKNMSSDELVEEYTKAAKTIEKAGNAYYALASLADQRVTGFIQFLEQFQIEGSKRGTTKFWGANTNPSSITEFLKTQVSCALDNYKKSISLSPQYAHEVVPRILQLYFDIGKYFTVSDSPEIPPMLTKLNQTQKEQILNSMTQVILKCQSEVRSAIWLNSITQLISRVEQPPKLEQHLFEFIRIAAQDYPQPAFWHLMSVKHSSLTQTKKQKFNVIISKITNSLPSDKLTKFNEIMNQFERITDGLINLAKTNPGSSKLKHAQASMICSPLVQACNGCKVLLPLSRTLMINSSSPAFNDSSKFECSPSIVQMEDDIAIFSSLQRPKKINLKGSDGKSYHFLCKKDDDLRKDMRMMEFASFINRVLSKDRRCRERSLSIVTFAVVCLDEQCGILEWAENTRAFRGIIDELYKQHGRGLSRNKICEYFCENDNGKNPVNLNEKKIQNFKTKVLPEYPPLLHEWFIRKFVTPARWFQSRLNFARSTSVWSMVGFIVGLGDRHTENILFNEVTGGVVHVDFCCMFDKAKTLPTPECVPFRLTQNFVDAMGVLGTDGPFSACSTFVLDSLRQKKQKLVSVLQTFVHDPLIEWKKGNQSPISTAKMVLKEVDRRLSGFSEDKSTFQSPECVVRALISQATNNNNLALMYVGWQPFL